MIKQVCLGVWAQMTCHQSHSESTQDSACLVSVLYCELQAHQDGKAARCFQSMCFMFKWWHEVTALA